MEYEYLFSKSLHEKLKEKIKGKIFCKVIDNTLVVNIETREGISHGMFIDDFAERLRSGLLHHEWIADMLVKEYRAKVLERFFY